MWHTAYQSGEPYLGAADDVEAAAHWKGEPGILFKALRDAGGKGKPGFVEEAPGQEGCYQVHDLWDHAPGYVEKRAVREAKRRAKGATISSLRAEAGRKGAEARWQKDGKRHPLAIGANGKRMANGVPSAPASAPLLQRREEGAGTSMRGTAPARAEDVAKQVRALDAEADAANGVAPAPAPIPQRLRAAAAAPDREAMRAPAPAPVLPLPRTVLLNRVLAGLTSTWQTSTEIADRVGMRSTVAHAQLMKLKETGQAECARVDRDGNPNEDGIWKWRKVG
jgi:hypothetical protein